MEGRDILILFICAIAILTAFPPTGHFKFTPSWQINIDTSNYRNGNVPTAHEKLPPPIVTDLDGDGFNDIVYVTSDYQIRVVDAAELYELKFLKSSKKSLPEPDVTFSSSLLPKIGIRSGRKPVAIQAGFIDELSPNRKQVIVVLTESWLVMCFDSELNLLWESNPVTEMNQNLYHSEASIMITPTPVRNGDRGLIVIGGRTVKKEFNLGHEHNERTDFEATEDELLSIDSNKDSPVEEDEINREDEDHFSYYAFEGQTGSLRWSHEPGDFEDAPSPDEFEKFNFGEFVDESFKQFFSRNLHHLGEQPWYEFSKDVLDQLPFRWRIREDTSLVSDRFDRRRQVGGSISSNSAYDPNLFSASSSSSNNDNKPPNVVVAKTSTGVEVIHLYSGRPVTTLKFNPGSVYSDINGDNVIDKIDAISERSSFVKKGEVSPQLDKCFGIVTSGTPTTQILFEGSICDVQTAFQKLRFGFELFDPPKLDKVEVVPPLVLNGGSNIIFLVSSGKITSYNSEGEANWQISTDVKWNSKLSPYKKKSALQRFPKLDSFRDLGGFPTLEVYPLGYDNFILAVGSSNLALISSDGTVFTESQTPGIINSPPIIKDWDSDGYYDIIFCTASGFYGWRLESTNSSFLYPLIIIVFIASLAIIAFSRSRSSPKKTAVQHPAQNSNFRL